MGPYFSLGDYTRKDPESRRVNLALKVSHSAHRASCHSFQRSGTQACSNKNVQQENDDLRILKLDGIMSLLKQWAPSVKKIGCGQAESNSALFVLSYLLSSHKPASGPLANSNHASQEESYD